MKDPKATPTPIPEDDPNRPARPSQISLPDVVLGALAQPPVSPDVLPGFQRKVRERSGGKFYGDQWSTSRHPPVATYLVTSALMLAVVLATYIVLAPLSGQPAPAPAPRGVHVIPVPGPP